MSRRIPVLGFEAMKDLESGAIVFSQTPSASAAVRARKQVKQRIQKSEESNCDLRERLKSIEQKLETAMQLLTSRNDADGR